MSSKVDYGALRAQTLGTGADEEAVTVNTRALIDKVLARYSGEWTVLRELLQNAADAAASKVKIEFSTIPSPTVPLPQAATSASLLQHTILHHTLKRLVVVNNGEAFKESDWSRLKRIAEGNPDETKIGAFGVGFYSVFSDCEEPFVSSGEEAMAFYWKGNSLFTRRSKLGKDQASADTTFVLDYRNATTPVPPVLPLAQFLASSLTFVKLSEIELWLDNWKLLSLKKLVTPGHDVQIPRGLNTKTGEGLMRINSVVQETVQLEAKWLNIVGWKAKPADVLEKTPTQAPSLRTFFSKFSSSSSSSSAAAKAAKEEKAAQEALLSDLMGEKRTIVFLQISTATLTTSVSKSFAQELERATKKPPPRTTRLAILTTTLEPETSGGVGATPAHDQVFASVLPSKAGRIYIGFPTHSTTGLAAHVSAPSIIPTVERESIDLNARWVKTWNQEMLRATGILCRIAWSASIKTLRESLSRSMSSNGRSKVNATDIDKVTPQAIDLLNQFTFHESTPAAQVGNLIEEAFWTCNASSIEILSSRGILASQHVRIATDELSFVSGIPVVPSAVFDKAKDFIQRLVDYGIITDITTGDIRKELENQALNPKQATEFLQWLMHKMRINELDAAAVKSLLEVTVVNQEEDQRVIVLGVITNFVNASRIPATMPTPETTIPFNFTKGFDKMDLERIGWKDLQIVPWLRYLVEAAGGQLQDNQDLLHSPEFAGSVLSVLSRQWEGLSQSSKASVIELLANRTIMPTKQGMRRPSAAYFPSVKLFEDLPIVSVVSIKEKFLVALGVRKTIELELIFQRLLTSEASSSSAAWSHVELVKYLASVQNDIPKADVAKLRKTEICSAEASGQEKGKERRYRVCDLFQPTDDLRALGLPILEWPGLFRESSEEGKFLRTLGLRSYPTEQELIRIIITAHANQNSALRDKALRYLTDTFHQHQYSTTTILNTQAAFLPIEGKTNKLVAPKLCFTNEKAAVMGFNILQRDLIQHAAKFGVDANPPIQDCVVWLVKNKPQSPGEARRLFEMFATRLNEIRGSSLQTLCEAEIVPVAVKNAPKSEKDITHSVKHISPSLCFLGSGDSKYADIFDYVDFGSEANSFLLRCGSKHEPTTGELAALVVHEPARIFSVFGSPERYLDLMMTLARSWNSLKKDKELVRSMKRSAFLLASTEFAAEAPKHGRGEMDDDILDEDDATVKTYQLAQPENITIADDVINYNLFKGNVLSAPPFEELESFYAALGAVSLSSLVEEKPRIGSTLADQRTATQLRRLVQERIKLLFHDIPKEQIQHDANWIEKNLSFVAVSSISVRKTLVGRNVSHVEETTAIPLNHHRLGMTISFTPGTRDFFNVSQALLHICLHRPKPQQALILTTLLETDLLKLRSRGYDVTRILRKRAHEARIAEEQRQQQLEEEQKRLQEAKAAAKHQKSLDALPEKAPVSMPGHFPDAIDGEEPENQTMLQQNRMPEPRAPKGLFSSLTRSLGISNSPQAPALPPPFIPDAPKSPTKARDVDAPQPVTSPESLQQNLLSAINASRAHNSTNVMTDPVVNEVKETSSFCDAKPKQDIEFVGESAPGIKIFLPRTLGDKVGFMGANAGAVNSFANILLSVAEVLHLPRKSLHIFYEENSRTIAFNSQRALFFNYKYFENLHFPDVQQGKTGDALAYWWVTTCHELAHNLVGDHSAAHSFYTESFVAQYFSRLAQKMSNTPARTEQPPAYNERG